MRSVIVVLAAILIWGCAGTSEYAPSQTAGGLGYASKQVGANVYKVSYHGADGQPREEVVKYALMRAAELTREKGEVWFAVIDNERVRVVREEPYSKRRRFTQELLIMVSSEPMPADSKYPIFPAEAALAAFRGSLGE